MPEAPAGLPFLKWPGGKRWLAPALTEMFDHAANTTAYVEPFLGGGAVFFAGRFGGPRLSDSNADLIATYRAVRDDHEAVIRQLRALPTPTPTTYALVARRRPRTEATRAARFLYLNRLAFNGVWRVNGRGIFNVPYGHRPPNDLVAAERLRACAAALQGASLETCDYRDALSAVHAGDLVYCDPPYTVSHNNNGFIRYNENLFSWADQRALAARAAELTELGAHVVVSNAAHHDMLSLYPSSAFHAFRIIRTSRVAGAVSHRRPQAEMLFVSRHAIEDRRRGAHLVRAAAPPSASVQLLR